jgi:mono/diheme cytochrome c family protein
MKKLLMSFLGLAATILVAAGACAYFGAFNVGADAPHLGMISNALALVRDRSIELRAADLAVPDLADRDLITLGAEHYSEMCTGCHLAPGMSDSEMRQGLYPKPPNLFQRRIRSPAESFWIIKHGIKMSAMPAWGSTHDDRTIWAIVAFLQQLPTLDMGEYAALAGASDASDHDHEPGHHDHEHVASGHEGDATNPPAAEPGRTTMDQSSTVTHSHEHASGG